MHKKANFHVWNWLFDTNKGRILASLGSEMTLSAEFCISFGKANIVFLHKAFTETHFSNILNFLYGTKKFENFVAKPHADSHFVNYVYHK